MANAAPLTTADIRAIAEKFRLPQRWVLRVDEGLLDGLTYATLVAAFPNADPTRDDEWSQTYSSHCFSEHELANLTAAYVKIVFEKMIRYIWHHELDEWLLFDGRHMSCPHTDTCKVCAE